MRYLDSNEFSFLKDDLSNCLVLPTFDFEADFNCITVNVEDPFIKRVVFYGFNALLICVYLMAIYLI